jgi:hypothetical protein
VALSWRLALTKALDYRRSDILREFDNAAVEHLEIAGDSPINLRSPFTLSPVVHEAFGGGCVLGGCFSSSDHDGITSRPNGRTVALGRDRLVVCDALHMARTAYPAG